MVTVTDLYTARGLALKSKGRNARGAEFAGPCPDCGGKDRFLVWPEQNDGRGSYACRQCEKRGDVIQFLMDFDGLDFKAAAAAAGVKLEAQQRRSMPEPPKPREAQKKQIDEAEPNAPERDAAKWLAQAEHYVSTRHDALQKSRNALAYLEGRGLDAEAVQAYRLGVQQGENGKAHIMRLRKVWGLPDGQPTHEGGKIRKSVWLPRGIVIPSALDGQVRRIRVRRPDADREKSLPNMKYYVVPGSEMVPLYLAMKPGLFQRAVACVVVEAELDAMLVHRAAGDLAAVLGVGTSGLRHLPPSIMRAMRDMAIILVATDVGDSNGAGTHGWELWRETFPQAVRWPCLGGKDPGEMYQTAPAGEGHGLIRGWVLSGLPEIHAQAAIRAMREHRQSAAEPQPEPAPAEQSPPELETKAPQALPGFNCSPAYSLDGWYIGTKAVLSCLRENGLRLEPYNGDVRLRGTERLPRSQYAKLLPFLHRHREYIDEIAREMNT